MTLLKRRKFVSRKNREGTGDFELKLPSNAGDECEKHRENRVRERIA